MSSDRELPPSVPATAQGTTNQGAWAGFENDPARRGQGDSDSALHDLLFGAMASGTAVHTTGTDDLVEDAQAAGAAQLSLIETIAHNATLALLMLDSRGHCIFMNPAAEAMTGFAVAEVQGKPLHAFIHHSHPDGSAYPMAECPIDRALPTRHRMHGEEIFIHRDGHFYPVSFTASPIHAGGRPVGTVIEVQDITSRREAEAVLREQAEIVEIIGRTGQVLTAELDLERLVQAITDATTELTGAAFGAFFYNVLDERGEWYTLYTISGVEREAFSRFPMPRNTEVFAPTFSGTAVVRLDDVTADPRYGKNEPYYGMPEGHLPVRSHLAVPVVSRSGEVLGGLFFGHAQVGVFGERAERLAIGLAAQAAIAIDNARLYRAAQQALSLRDEFLASVSHDLRTPLATIKGLAQLLMRQARRLDSPQLPRMLDYLGQIDRSAATMAAMIDELLDLARLESGRPLELDRSTVDLVALVRRMAGEQARLAPLHRLRVESSDEGVTGSWDAIRIERVVGNLLSNAIKYSPDGGDVVISVRRISDERGDCLAELQVQDAGVGIPAAEVPLVWEPFRRASNAERRTGGSGIGLASVRRIVEHHGGMVGLQSVEGEGTTVTVRLPCLPMTAHGGPA